MTHDDYELLDADAIGEDVAGRARAQSDVVAVLGPRDHAEAVLRVAAAELGVPVTNVGLELGEMLHDVLPRHRPVRLERALYDLVPETAVVLSRISLLFLPSLAVQPLPLFRKLRRTRPVVIHWPGELIDDHLVYAQPGHPEHVRERADGFEVVTISALD